MSAKSLLRKIKSIFGFSGAGRDTETGPSTDGDDATSVTVEREPDTASEDAVKGTETDSGETPDETTDDDGGSESVEIIKGIGPTYCERLEDAGLGTVAELAASDVETVADAAETSESRAESWVDRAQNR